MLWVLKIRLNETVLLSTQNKYKLEDKKLFIHLRPQPGLQIRKGTGKLFLLFISQNICCGYSKGAQTILIWNYVTFFAYLSL